MSAMTRVHDRSTDDLPDSRMARLLHRRSRRRLLSTLVVGALVATSGMVAVALAPASSAEAATLGPITTSFEIDGNTSGSDDWASIVGSTPRPAYVTASGHQSTGIIDAQRSADSGATLGSPGTCGASETNSVFPGGAKIDDNPWAGLITNSANAKGDACTGGSAYEVVTINGVEHVIFYAYWTRLSGNGDMTSYEMFEGPAAGRSDDYLIEFNYDPSTGTSVRVLGWNGSKWTPIAGPVVYQAAVGLNTDTNTSGADATFGEMAVDLTASGLLPVGTCRTFLDSGFITRTGNSATATLQDILKADEPLSISNCGSLVVTKAANPSNATSDDVFDYTVARTGGGAVHDGSLVGTVADAVGGNNGLGAPIGVGDTHNWSPMFAGTDYVLNETIDAGAPWTLQSIACSVTNPSTGQVENFTGADFNIYVGATTTCTMTNATSGVTVTKQAQGDPATFDFTLTGGKTAALTAGQTSTTFGYVPGTAVTITELPEPGTPAWKLQGIQCSGGNPQVNVAAGTVTVTTTAGTVVNCTYTNRQDGEIRIVKNVAGANGEFDFTGNWGQGSNDFSLTTVGGTANAAYTNVTPGQYTVSELTPEPDYDLTNLICTDDVQGGTASTSNVATGTGTINLDPGELVVCTFTNTQRGTIIVDKVTDPAHSAASFDFSLDGPETDADFALTDDAQPYSTGLVPAGAYTLAEASKANWSLTNMDCGAAGSSKTSPIGFTLAPGTTVICTVLNTATAGKVTVNKVVEGVPAGYAWSFPITIDPVPAGQLATQNVTNADPSVEWKDLDVGTEYTLVEPDVSGWDSSAFTCTGLTDADTEADGFQFVVTPGLDLSCSITNTVEPGQVEVEKTVSGFFGDSWSFDISISPVPAGQQGTQQVTQADDTVKWDHLQIGTVYTLTEDLPAGWAGGIIGCTGLADASDAPGFQFTATPGLKLDCDVTNRAVPGTAEITKTSVGGDGSFSFVLTPDEGDPVQQVITTVGGTGTTSFANLQPGTTYSLAESNAGSGWIAGDLECTVEHADGSDDELDPAEFTVAVGDAIECAIVNTAKGTIVIVKHVEGADGSFDFTGTWPGKGGFSIMTTEGAGSDTSTNVPAGTYTVSELLTNQYLGKLVSCTDSAEGGQASTIAGLIGTIKLDPGETVTCTYSNTERGEIIVDKVVPGGSDQEFGFEFEGDGPTQPFDLADADTPWSSDLIDPNETYTVSEAKTAGWTTTLLCVGGADVTYSETDAAAIATIDLNPGEVVTCTYTNTPNPGKVEVEKLVEGVPDGWDFSFDISISPKVGDQPTTQAVTDEDPTVEWTGLVVGETYTLTEAAIDGWTEGAISCTGLADGDAAAAGFQFTVTPGLELSCSVTNVAEPGSVEVTKVVHGPIGDVTWSFDVAISPVPGGQSGTQAVTNDDPKAAWDELSVGTTYTLTEALPAGWTGGDFACTGLEDLSADPGYQFLATPGLELDCTVTNVVAPPTGLIEKTVSSTTQRSDGTWDITYTVKVTNQSVVLPLVYDLSDEPQLGTGIVINSASATGPAGSLASTWTPFFDSRLADDQQLAASGFDLYTITINVAVPEVVYDTGMDECSPEGEFEDGGFRNTAYLTVGDGEPQPASDCSEPGRALVDKHLVGSPENLGLGNWRVVYDVTVTSVSDHQLYYVLEDDLGFPAGVNITSAVATNDAGVDTTTWNGASQTVLAIDEVIAPNAVHTYTVIVEANVALITDIDSAQCVESTSGNGFFNSATLTNGRIVSEDDDCATIPVGRISLTKTVDNSAFDGVDLADLGLGDGVGLLQSSDWNLTGAGPLQFSELGSAGLVFTVPIGDYNLSESPTALAASHPLLRYYLASGWSCDDEIGGDSIGSVIVGALTSCELTNVASLVDVGIEKDYVLAEGSDAVDAGDEFDYVLRITNHSSQPVAELDVADTIDSRFEITGAATFEGPGIWAESTVGNEFAAHGVGAFAPGDVITVTIPVRMPQPAPVEAPDVVGPDDPAPVVEPVDLTDIPNEACVAITDTEGSLPDLIAENDCDDVDVPQKAIDSGAYPRCVNDVPYLYYDIQVSDSVEPGPITVTWTSGDGTLTKTETIPWDQRSGRLLWPGAAVDANGIPYQFPGWRPITEQDLITPPTPGTRFLDLILDETVPTYPWRDMVNPATVTFSINPSQAVLVTYPQALPACAIVRPPDLDIEKTASVSSTAPGGDYEYTLKVTSVGTGGAEPVEIFDAIPTDLRVDSIDTAPAPAFPRWEDCQVTGKDSAGYGGVLHCDLLGVLGPNLTTAPPITLGVHVNPGSHATSISNTGEVCWDDADAPADAEAVITCADDTVDVPVKQAAIASTGLDVTPFVWGGGVLALLGAVLVGLTIIRRRREGRIGA